MHSPNTYTETALPNCPFHLHLVPGGTFLMGSSNDEPDASDREKPAHPVELDPFYIAEFPVTQDLWMAVMGENPSGFPGERRPVENVSWNDITKRFLPALNKKCGKAYRLPTEAEWEYAARGGPFWKDEGYRYAGSDDLGQVGWYAENSGNETHEVGLLLPNALGLYDMSGNVWEWCADWFSDEWYAECAARGTVKNPPGPEKGDNRVYRGGGYFAMRSTAAPPAAPAAPRRSAMTPSASASSSPPSQLVSRSGLSCELKARPRPRAVGSKAVSGRTACAGQRGGGGNRTRGFGAQPQKNFFENQVYANKNILHSHSLQRSRQRGIERFFAFQKSAED